jgi:sulfotransferase family protein
MSSATSGKGGIQGPVLAGLKKAIRRTLPAPVRKMLARTIVDLNHDYRAAIFLAGTGRSGTTWISDLINYDNAYRDMFEPFHGGFVPMCRRFYYALYLRPHAADPAFLRPARAILEGRLRNRWVDRANKQRFPARRLVKEVRANLWLGWLKQHFPELPIVFLMRHPCAVASSRITLEWPSKIPQFLAQNALFEDYLEPFRSVIERAESPFLRHVAVWCIHNYVPLRQFRPGEIHLAFYENFCEHPEDEIARLFQFLGKRADDRVFARLNVPSRMARTTSAVATSGLSASVNAWRKHVSNDDLDATVRMLEKFGLEGIYNADSMPSREGAIELMAANRL